MSSGTENQPATGEKSNARHRGGYRRGSGRGGRVARGPRGDGNGENQVAATVSGGIHGGKSRGIREGRGGHDRRQPPGTVANGNEASSGQQQDQKNLIQATMVSRREVKPDADDAASDPDSSICFICANPVTYSSIAPCNHVTCHICALRMRALYKNKACAHCRTESEWVIFSKSENKRFEEFQASEIITENDTLGIKFEDKTIADDTTLLLYYNCPDGDCDWAFQGWPDLHYHVKTVHNKLLCDLCSRNKKVFTHEHTLFTPQELRKHERIGDDQPGSENQSGFKGHPECEFCRQRFYSSDELYIHCRDRHERCFLCDRRNIGSHQEYYVDYQALAAHFSQDHFVCMEQDCLEKKFVAFDNEMDLKAHQLEVHPNLLSKGALRDVRRVDMRSLEDRSFQHQQGGRRGANRGRGHMEPEEQTIRTEQQMSRAELAYHRTLAVQSAQSTTSRNFGGHLTDPAPIFRSTPQGAARAAQSVAIVSTPTPPPTAPAAIRPAQITNPSVPAAAARPPPRPADISAEVAFPPLAAPRVAQAESSSVSGASNAGRPVTEDTRRVKHGAVLERARNMLRNNETKMAAFKTHVSNYQQGRIDAAGLVDILWPLFDVHAPHLGKLIKELADLFEDEQKKVGLLKAWYNWKVVMENQNEDYPPFAGASSSSTGTNASRILKLKSSTSQSARSATARQGAWGSAAVPNPRNTSPAPKVFKSRASPGPPTAVPWVSSNSSTPSATPGPRRTVGSPDDFPSLPVKPPPPPGWGPIKRKEHGAPVPSGNPWGQGESPADPSDAEAGPSRDGGGRKKGKQKQLLFHVGL